MILKAIIDDQEYSLNVPEALMLQGEDFFARLDADMDKGWQMSREWVQKPNRVERCQIVADKLLTALEKENHKLGMLMAGYILSRMPEVESVEIDIAGEIQNTRFIARGTGAFAQATVPETAPPLLDAGRVDDPETMEQAENDVSKVYKVGKVYRFSILDRAAGAWQDSPMFASEQEAERARREAVMERYQTLKRGS